MFGQIKNKHRKALEANELIHDAIIMGIADKYITEDNLKRDEFELQLLGRALNWAVPRLDYDFENDLRKVENEEFRKRFQEDNDQIFKKGLNILNADPELEKLIDFYVAYEIYLFSILFSTSSEEKYPGIKRMRKFLVQSSEKEPQVQSLNFKENYKNLFINFNKKYGEYGKVLKKETIDSLFSLI